MQRLSLVGPIDAHGLVSSFPCPLHVPVASCGKDLQYIAVYSASSCVTKKEAFAMEEVAQACIRALVLTGSQSVKHAAEPAVALFPAARTLR